MTPTAVLSNGQDVGEEHHPVLFKPILSHDPGGASVWFKISEDQNDPKVSKMKSNPMNNASFFPADRRCSCFQVIIVIIDASGSSCQSTPSHQDDHLQVVGLQPARSVSLFMAEGPCSKLFCSPSLSGQTEKPAEFLIRVIPQMRNAVIYWKPVVSNLIVRLGQESAAPQ